MNWYLAVLKKYCVFEGRARRKEYWMYTLVNTIIGIIMMGVLFSSITSAANQANYTNNNPDVSGLITIWVVVMVYSLATLLPTLAVTIRRLHDTGRSGAYFLLAFVPFVNILLLVFMFIDGDIGKNRYGEDPKNRVAE